MPPKVGTPIKQVDPVVTAWDLGKGESEVISYALHHPNVEAIVDDRAARNCAKSLGISFRGTIGIILLAKKKKKISNVTPLLDRLIQAKIGIDSVLLKTAKKLANEK